MADELLIGVLVDRNLALILADLAKPCGRADPLADSALVAPQDSAPSTRAGALSLLALWLTSGFPDALFTGYVHLSIISQLSSLRSGLRRDSVASNLVGHGRFEISKGDHLPVWAPLAEINECLCGHCGGMVTIVAVCVARARLVVGVGARFCCAVESNRGTLPALCVRSMLRCLNSPPMGWNNPSSSSKYSVPSSSYLPLSSWASAIASLRERGSAM